jgi:cell division protein FtsB
VSSRASSAVTVALLFLAGWLVVDGVAGERGWLANRRNREQVERQQAALDRVKLENEQRLDLIRRLQAGDPPTYEDFARRVGFIHPGEKLFVVRDAPKEK